MSRASMNISYTKPKRVIRVSHSPPLLAIGALDDALALAGVSEMVSLHRSVKGCISLFVHP